MRYDSHNPTRFRLKGQSLRGEGFFGASEGRCVPSPTITPLHLPWHGRLTAGYNQDCNHSPPLPEPAEGNQFQQAQPTGE